MRGFRAACGGVRAAGVALAFLTGAYATAAAVPPEPAASPIDRLAWLAGCWSRESAKRIVEEQWMTPRGGMMLGMSRTVSKETGATIEFEAVRIEEREGGLVFIAKPSGQPEASFQSIELTGSRVVFENPEHDFPQRVGYERTREGGLAAWIEGKSGPDREVKRVDFPYARAECPSGGSQP